MIVMDSREPQEIYDMLKNLGLDVKKKQLHVGDYIVSIKGYEVCVERKEIGDYIASLETGRLQNQLYNMSTYYEQSFLVVVGYISYALMYSKFPRKAYIASLISASLRRSPEGKSGIINVVNLETDYDFALFLKYLEGFMEKGEIWRVPKLIVNKSDKLLTKAAMLTAIPGVGEERAVALIKHFGSIKKVIEATPSELSEVPGIGEQTAKNIYKFFREVIK